MSSENLVKHPLSAEVEAASGGRQVVLQTAKGQPTYMNVIQAFRCEDLGPEYGTGLHPAFVVGGVEKSEIFIGTYQAVIRDGEALSLPNEDPVTEITFDQARAACVAAGAGFHLTTNWEWAMLALLCQMNEFGELRGNTASGLSHADRRDSGKIAKYGRTLTGSGPDSWRHDGTSHGISDLVGNVWEWVDGLKTKGGEIIMPADNDFNLPEKEWPTTSAFVDFCDGMQISSSIQRRSWSSHTFTKVTSDEDVAASTLLKKALLCSVPGQTLQGRFWANNSASCEALPIRGGSWRNGGNAGLAALDLYYERSNRSIDLGFRPAFIP